MLLDYTTPLLLLSVQGCTYRTECFQFMCYTLIEFRGFLPKSCDCKWGYKGADCGTPCITAPRKDVCSLNPNSIRLGCSSSIDVPCNGRGTFDSQDFRYQPGRDDVYDCEPDGSCACRRGYQGQACEIGEQSMVCLKLCTNSQMRQNALRPKQISSQLLLATS